MFSLQATNNTHHHHHLQLLMLELKLLLLQMLELMLEEKVGSINQLLLKKNFIFFFSKMRSGLEQGN